MAKITMSQTPTTIDRNLEVKQNGSILPFCISLVILDGPRIVER